MGLNAIITIYAQQISRYFLKFILQSYRVTPISITQKPSDQTCDRINQKHNKAAKQLATLLS